MERKLGFVTLIVLVFSVLASCKKDDVAPTPIVVSFAPTDGVVGTPVVIVGTNFSTTLASNVVKFNGKEAAVTASTATSITALVPGDATSGSISVSVGGKTGTSSGSFRADLLFKAAMTGLSEVPPNSSTATGAAVLTYNKDAKVFTVIVTYSGITPNNGHIHKGAVGVSGPVIYPFSSPISSPISYTSSALTVDQETDLIGGLNYVNLHSVAFPNGEIRGQLTKQ